MAMATAAKSDRVEELLRLYLDDFQVHARDCLYIRDHNTARIVPLELNRGQSILNEVAEKQRAEYGFIRIIFLKSRRFGGSTLVEGRFYSNTSLRPNRSAFIVAHERDSTNTIFEMAKLMHERNPIAPATRYSNEKLLRFDNDAGTGLKSEYRVSTAENVDAGRSQGIHYLHISEEAFFGKQADTLLNGLLQCLPDPPAPHECFRESTANGFGNTFQRDVFDTFAEGRYPYFVKDGITYAWKNPRSDWILVFIPWFVHDRYTRDFKNEAERAEFERTLGKQVFDKGQMQWIENPASRLKREFGLTLEQLNWREWAIENKVRGVTRDERERIFRQEYPSSVEEAFLTTGANIYSKDLCDLISQNCHEPVLVGEPVDRAGKTKIRPNKYGHFSLWRKPDPNEPYFITCDPGGGIKPSHEDKNIEPDPTCIDVWNHRTGEQVAQWHGHIDYTMIGDLIALIGRIFITKDRRGGASLPIAAVELQNHGFTVVGKLRELSYPQFEAKHGEPGWLTNAKTKPQMIDKLLEFAQDGLIQIRSRETVSEMRTYIEENGKFNAAQGCHDDRVITAAIASMIMSLLPRRARARGDEDERDAGTFDFGNISDRARRDEETDYQEVYV